MTTKVDLTREAREARIARVKTAGHTLSLTELADELGVSPKTVTRYRRVAGIARPHTSGGLPPFEERLAHGRRLAEMGESASTIARLAHLHKSTVAREFPEASWTREQRAEALALQRRLRHLDVGPLAWPGEAHS